MILGSRGQLGTDLVQAFTDWDVHPLTHAELDICDPDQVARTIEEVKPDVVINTAAFHKVEDCEDNPPRAFQVNALAVRQLAQVCHAHRATLVHLSTDYVFGGDARQPYEENAAPGPVNVYGASKLAGETLLRQACPRHYLVRTSGLYGVAGASGKGGNFVELMIRLAREGKPIRVVNDQIFTPTYTGDLADKIKELVQTKAFGLYHVTNSGYCSWYEFAVKIFNLLRLKADLTPTTTVDFGARVQRPAYSVLGHRALHDLGLESPRPWSKALEAYLIAKGYLSAPHAKAA
jgi:dTDP-4-dehydrorhamnose reductase